MAAGQTGSFLNMAPEVVLNEPYDEKADIFSMGCCYFEVRCLPSTPSTWLCNQASAPVVHSIRQLLSS